MYSFIFYTNFISPGLFKIPLVEIVLGTSICNDASGVTAGPSSSAAPGVPGPGTSAATFFPSFLSSIDLFVTKKEFEFRSCESVDDKKNSDAEKRFENRLYIYLPVKSPMSRLRTTKATLTL